MDQARFLEISRLLRRAEAVGRRRASLESLRIGPRRTCAAQAPRPRWCGFPEVNG